MHNFLHQLVELLEHLLETDLGFMNNWLNNVFGISESMSVTEGMVAAGQSTTAGFATVQTVQNIVSKRNWTDN